MGVAIIGAILIPGKAAMRLLGLLLVGALLACVPKLLSSTSPPAAVSSNGFVSAPLPDAMAANPHQVLVVGPDCDSPEGVKTRELTRQLIQHNIPVQQASSVAFGSDSGTDFEAIDRVDQVMQAGSPIVFVRGKAKANPGIEEVIAEYHQPSSK
ncbi:hypothetical protein DO97_08685 [Neosynechococcus sphagnicola sy1]|uniref:Uncharacterized protein n=1 Tax=Neosynechococcus sphagnicola sy1 TaxID=1497020 RepID=A0A098TIQ4_9CYAN|nr:hypothetical protein [Neosynechococcus sphagnicola]KGF72440.1 hypothetical protein DO97_08685 [Neosynechococcus sphagnicola sy1]